MIRRSNSSILDRFRYQLRKREEELKISDYYDEFPPISTEEIVEIYELVLSDLTSNSKLVIGELTTIAGEHRDHAEGIADAICARIFEVPAEHKLSSLYLLDSIVKNIGCEYVRCFASHLAEMFCETYRQVHPKYCPSMRHLFRTWSAVFPSSVLHKIETELQFSEPITQQSSDINAFKCSRSPRPAHGIHVNPKYLEARHQFEHSVIESIHETDISDINAHKMAFGKKRKGRDDSASPNRWSGASLTFHNDENEREIMSSLYRQKPVTAHDQYDADHPEYTTSRVGSRKLSPPGNSTHVSSISGAEKLLSSKTKRTRLPTSPSGDGPTRSLSPSDNKFTREKSPWRVPPLQSRFAYKPSKFNANGTKRDNYLTEYQPDDGYQLVESSWSYNLRNGYNQQGPRALIDAYGNYRGKETLNEKPLKVDINVNSVLNKSDTKSWQNSEEDEYMWEDMSPTLANQRSIDVIPSNLPLGSSTRSSLEMPSASLSKPDFRRGSWDPHALLPVVDDSVTTTEEGISILGPGVGSTSDQRSKYAVTYSQGLHYSQQSWKTRQHLSQTGGHTSFSMAPSSGQVMSSLTVRTLDTEQHIQRFPNVMSRMASSSSDFSTLPPASTVNYSRDWDQSQPKAPIQFHSVNVNVSHQRSLLPSFSHQKQISDHVVLMDIHKPLVDQTQLPNQRAGLISLNQQSQRPAPPLWTQVLQPRDAHETFIPPFPSEVSPTWITQQPTNHGHNPSIHGTTTRSVFPNQISGLPSSFVNDHGRPSTYFHAHQGTLNPLPVGSVPNASQMGTTSQNMSPAASHHPASNAFSGLINSLVAQGLISMTSLASVQDSVGVEFNPDLLKVRYEYAINALYSDLPRKCTTCGLRFMCQDKHSSHMDWHVTKNRVSKNCKQKPSRKWFVSTSLWLSGAEAVGSDAIPGFGPTEADVEGKAENEIAVPADENQDACALCGETFEDFYSDETEEWMYRGAVYLNAWNGSISADRSQLGPIVHAKCRPESEVITLEDFRLEKEGNNKNGG